MGDINTVGIVGSGIMGAGLAEVAARVRVPGHRPIAHASAGAEAVVDGRPANLDRQVDKGKLDDDERDAILARITATDHLGQLADCDLVIESVVEDLAVKKELFAELEQIVKPEGILATNTSTLPVDRAGDGDAAARPGVRHPLLQPGADDEAGRGRAADHRQRRHDQDRRWRSPRRAARTPSRSPTAPASSSTRCCSRTSTTPCGCSSTGTASMEDIDTAMKGGCNFPMGPFALLDLVGLDTSVAILDALYAEFRDPNYAAVPTLRRMVAAGHLGRKTKRGFYEY